ncbi:MAG: multiheme c-type cytochrome [Sulfurimonas sp.]
MKRVGRLMCITVAVFLIGCDSNNNFESNEPAEGELGYQTILSDGNISYIDYKGEERVSVPTAADAEYHTGTGFDHTLLDSADKKCQNCHNELYDTWKGSMHGKSWTDPIFQSKFQDFLRTHLAKIGTNPTGDKEYTEQVFKGAAQTCIKCHAPSAYYSGDVKVSVAPIEDATDINTTAWSAMKAANEVNEPNGEIAVIAANSQQNKVYKATFQIGHEANREGINCAFCHSIETPRLMREGDSYTLANAVRVGPHGPVKASAGDTLYYSPDSTDSDMNKFFRLWGPEKPKDYSLTGDATETSNRTKDGRYAMVRKDINGTDGKIHFTGGPFYGPFGVTGVTNENETDDTNRSAYINPHFADEHLNPAFDDDHAAAFNHFGDHGKALCLSCHQRSAGAAVPEGEDGEGSFMELCSTWNAVTTGGDNNMDDTVTSPKCQKCHMERIEGRVLHQWARPDKLWTKEANPSLTAHFDPADPENLGDESPVVGEWLNSHGFLGASKTGGDKAAAVGKIKSGFGASLNAWRVGDTLVVKTTLSNKTAHMFPGAHPMRRVLTRLIITDGENNMLTPTATNGISEFADTENILATLSGKRLDDSQPETVTVMENGSGDLEFPGKVADLDGSAVGSQKFDGSPVTVTGTDSTIANQTIEHGVTTGTVTNAAIVESGEVDMFTRIYGHETGKKYNEVFVVRPGFDSNMVEKDNRLSPNETEVYYLTYDISGKTGISATYKVYYMQKGANGKFPQGSSGFLSETANPKLMITEVFSDQKSVE